MSQERVKALNLALAQGRLSRMGYVLKCMYLAEEAADQIIKNTPEAQAARLELQANDMAANRPREIHRNRHPQD